MSNTESLIRPIIFETYGKGAMVEGLVRGLARYIDAYEGDDRQRAVMLKCWDWFSGGSTAASVATKVEAALEAREGVVLPMPPITHEAEATPREMTPEVSAEFERRW